MASYSRWRYFVQGEDAETGRKLTLVDETYTYAMNLPETIDVGTALVVMNELIARMEDALCAAYEGEPPVRLPFFDKCIVCKEIVSDNMLVAITGPQPEGGANGPNTCARCWAKLGSGR